MIFANTPVSRQVSAKTRRASERFSAVSNRGLNDRNGLSVDVPRNFNMLLVECLFVICKIFTRTVYEPN